MFLIAVALTVTIDGDQERFVANSSDVKLVCRYSASPPVSEVKWKKDGNVITRNASAEINVSRVNITHYNESQVQLLIIAATTRDAGNYTCYIGNGDGNSSDTIKLTIGGLFFTIIAYNISCGHCLRHGKILYNFHHLTFSVATTCRRVLKCYYDQIIDIHFLHFRVQYDFLTYLAKFQSITNIRSHSFFYFYFREFTAAITWPCSKAWLRIGENDVIFSKIPHGLKF